MEFEYTNNKYYKCAFLINDFERLVIVSALKSHKKKYFSSIEKLINKIETDPENEGQVTYQDKIEKLRNHLTDYEKLMKDFS
jgi:hypothetical protein